MLEVNQDISEKERSEKKGQKKSSYSCFFLWGNWNSVQDNEGEAWGISLSGTTGIAVMGFS